MCPVLQEDVLLVAILSHSSMDLIYFFFKFPSLLQYKAWPQAVQAKCLWESSSTLAETHGKET